MLHTFTVKMTTAFKRSIFCWVIDIQEKQQEFHLPNAIASIIIL